MRRRIEITTIERERIVLIAGQIPCPACQKTEEVSLRRLLADGLRFLKVSFFKPKEKNIKNGESFVHTQTK
jgi:hypothetical protein